jgi:hypothetical protein
MLTVLAPSERFSRQRRRRHKALTDWARQGLLQIARWLPDRRLIAVADTSYAAIELLSAVRERVCMIIRLRARLFAPPAPQKPGTIGRPRIIGERLPTLAECLADPNTPWRRLRVDRWYGGGERFAAPLGQKEIRLVLAAADDLRVPLPLADLLHDRFLALLANGGEKLDWSAIGGLAAKDAGMIKEPNSARL